jgi:predicted Zn-dependent protease
MEDPCRREPGEIADQPLRPGEIAWRLSRALVVAIAVAIAVWGGPFRPSPRQAYQRACVVLASDPARGELLLRALIRDAGGDFPDAQLQLGLRGIERDDWGEVERFLKTLSWDHADPVLLATLGGKALDAGRMEMARQCFSELSARETAYALVGLRGLAALHESEHRPDEALRCLEEIAQMVPDNPYLWQTFAEACAARHKPAAAAAAYRQVLRQPLRRRDEEEIRRRLVEQLIEAGDAVGARQELECLASVDDNQPPDFFALVEQAERLAAGSASGTGGPAPLPAVGAPD